MTWAISADNVNGAFVRAVDMIHTRGIRQKSQHGETLEMPGPVTVCYNNPMERVLFDPVRDSNPFLGFFEALWIIAGRDDVRFLSDIVSTMANYSDDGHRFYGAYGKRLRKGAAGISTGAKVDRDQIQEAVNRLRKNPDDRQVVMLIRDPLDMWYTGKDQPCNYAVDLKVRNGKLNMAVMNRSNDTVWGMMGTNVVQFSTLQEYMAALIGCSVGKYYQITTSMHVYDNAQWAKIRDHALAQFPLCPTNYYSENRVRPSPMFSGDDTESKWHSDLYHFFTRVDAPNAYGFTVPVTWYTTYFRHVVWPMWNTLRAWKAFQEDRTTASKEMAMRLVESIQADDWRVTAREWLMRRVDK
jgi:thymidylate synthase